MLKVVDIHFLLKSVILKFQWKFYFKFIFLFLICLSFYIFSEELEETWSKSWNHPLSNKEKISKMKNNDKHLEKATLSGGCFWCMEPPFEKLDGVHSVVSGYAGGKIKNPTYKQVSDGDTQHIESVQILYDPKKIHFSELINIFWRNIDPTQENGQFYDIGNQYSTVIFYYNDEQKKIAELSKKALEESGIFKKPIVTKILPIKFNEFSKEKDEGHQDYYKKNPIRYKFYRTGSGRDRFLEKTWKNVVWKGLFCKNNLQEINGNVDKKKESSSLECSVDFGGKNQVKAKALINKLWDQFQKFSKPSKKELSSKLSSLQFKVTQKKGTERPFKNEFWDNKRKGIYVDIVSGEPLFSSEDQYDSKTGWPSFTKPIDERFIVEKSDRSLFFKRTEVRSKLADSHLGHVFKDGPQPTGLRYCINSASLKFIPYDQLQKEGYEDLIQLLD